MCDLTDLLNIDRQLRAEADELLDNRGLRRLLEEYAPVHVVGSYALGLMVWRDLDILMDAPRLTIHDFLDLGKRVSALLSPTKISFHDNLNHQRPEEPRGLYWGVRLGDIKKGAWKIDIWAFDSDLASAKLLECENLKQRLNPQNRIAILGLKSHLWQHPMYRDQITSQDIYDAVLQHGATTLTDFWSYVGNRSRQ